MSLDTIHADGIEDNLKRWAANPGPDPGTSFRVTGFLGAGLKALPAAGFDVAAAGADAVSGFTDSLLVTGGGEGFSQPGQQEQKAGFSFDTAGGNALRRRAEEFSPDPLTAHAADQVLHGLVRFGAKAVGAVGTMGPFGALLLGAEETENETQRLRAQGVDTGTALKVGAVQGVTSAAGAVMPLGGKTILQTLGLVAAGGPGMFMGQEALSKKILQSAGQNDQASLHNPFDPLGLAVSTVIPGAFGALHMNGVRRTALEQVVEHIESGGQRYGKDGELLTSPKGAEGEMQVVKGTQTDPGYGVRPADLSGTKEQRANEIARMGRDYLAAMANKYGDSNKALAAYNAGPGAVDKAIAAHGDDWLKNLPRETQEYVHKANALGARHASEVAAQDPANVDAARVATTNDALTRSLPDTPDAVAQVQRAADIVAEDGGRAAEQVISEPAGEATPPVADGFVRYYHGGEPAADHDGALWFTSDLRDGQGWADRSPNMRLWYVDVPADHPARGGEPEFGVLPPSRMEFPPEIANQRRPVVEPPAQGEQAERAAPRPTDNALPPHDSITLAGDEPTARGEELGSTQREAAKQTAEAGKPAPAANDPEARARDIELLQKRRTVLQSLLDCLEAA